jgi:hypothetical protein
MNLNDSFNNIKRDLETWFQFPVLLRFGAWYVNYKYNWGSFNHVNPDYSSYRYRARHFISGFYELKLDPGYNLEVSYTWSWVKERDFTNEATLSTDFFPGENQTIKKNIYRGHQVKVLLRKTFATHLFGELSSFYYMNTNNYRTWAGEGKLKYTF